MARTLLDLAEVLGRRQLERTFDQADVQRQLDLNTITEQLDRNRARKGAGIVRALLDEHYIGSTLTWSELEEAMLGVTRSRPSEVAAVLITLLGQL